MPFARARIKALRATGLKYAIQQFEIEGCSIKVRIEGEHEFITLGGGGDCTYQFFYSPDHTPDYRGDATYVHASGSKLTIQPRGSTLTADQNTPPRWPYSEVRSDIVDFMPFRDIWQVQGIAEYTYYAKGTKSASRAGVDPKQCLVSSWGAASPLVTLMANSGIVGADAGCTYDINYDIAPTLLTRGSKEPPVVRVPDADWYRRAAFKHATSALHGSRTFIVMTDTSNVFHVYPAGAPADSSLANPNYASQGIKTNVAEKYVKRVAAPLPAWVRKPSGASRDFAVQNSPPWTYPQKVPQYLWSFNSTCTKACAVVYEDRPAVPMPAQHQSQYAGDIVEALPGMVEFNLEIVITGPLLEDFTFSMTPGRSSQPTVAGDFIMAAEYAWEVPGAAALDDMVMVVGEVGYASDDLGFATPVDLWVAGNPSAHKCMLLVKNYESGATVRAFVGNGNNAPLMAQGGWTSIAKPMELSTSFLSCDLRSLSFVVQQRYVEYSFTEKLAPVSVVFSVNYWAGGQLASYTETHPKQYTQPVLDPRRGLQAQRFQVYVGNALVDEQYIDPDSPVNTALNAAHSDTTARTKFPVGHTTSWAASFYFSTHVIPFEPRRELDNVYHGGAGPGSTLGSFSLGAILYGVIAGQTFQHDFKSHLFCVHPDLHWSVITDPVLYFSGAPDGALSSAPNVSAIVPRMRQGRLDVICFRGKGAQTTRTSHIKAHNKAFGTALTEQSYRYTFSTHAVGAAQFLKVQGMDELCRSYIRVVDGVGTGAFQDLFKIDARSMWARLAQFTSLNLVGVSPWGDQIHVVVAQTPVASAVAAAVAMEARVSSFSVGEATTGMTAAYDLFRTAPRPNSPPMYEYYDLPTFVMLFGNYFQVASSGAISSLAKRAPTPGGSRMFF